MMHFRIKLTTNRALLYQNYLTLVLYAMISLQNTFCDVCSKYIPSSFIFKDTRKEDTCMAQSLVMKHIREVHDIFCRWWSRRYEYTFLNAIYWSNMQRARVSDKSKLGCFINCRGSCKCSWDDRLRGSKVLSTARSTSPDAIRMKYWIRPNLFWPGRFCVHNSVSVSFVHTTVLIRVEQGSNR